LIDINNFFNNDVIMSSLVTNLNSSTVQEIANWVTTTVESRRRRRVGGVYWAPHNSAIKFP